MTQLRLSHDRYFDFRDIIIKENLDYCLHPDGDVTVYFKKPGDGIMFLLKWS